MAYPFDDDPEREARRRQREAARRARQEREHERELARRQRSEALTAAREALKPKPPAWRPPAWRPRLPAWRPHLPAWGPHMPAWQLRAPVREPPREAWPVSAPVPVPWTEAPTQAQERIELRERFLTLPMAAALAFFVLFAITFDNVVVDDDGLYYYLFLRRVFGDPSPGFAYQFGSFVWNSPFYAVAKVWAAVVGVGNNYHYGEIAIAVASNVAAIVTLYLGWRLLRDLSLPRGPAVLLLTLFGSPLFYYAVMRPSYKHAADALYMTAAFWLLLRAWRSDRAVYTVGAGACFALLFTTRSANVALLLGPLILLVRGERWRTLWAFALGVTTAGVVLYAVPVVLGIPFTRTPNFPAGAFGEMRLALGHDLTAYQFANRTLTLSPLAPLKMLFTLHRGLFVWTPVTLLATIGYVLLVRRDRGDNRPFLVAIGSSALALLLVHVMWGQNWDGGGSFSNRYLAGLFPFYAIGLAELFRRYGPRAIALATVVTLWSVLLALIMTVGYRNNSPRDGVVQIVESYTGPYHYPPPHSDLLWLSHKVKVVIQDRWTLLWRELT